MTAELGVLEWFELGEAERVERVVSELRSLGVQHLRTGVSWANWFAHGGPEWYDWLLPRLARDFDVLPCVTYTPPSLGVARRSSSPPRRTRDYADFVDVVITRLGRCFSHIELWNEPNARAEWDYTLDPQWTAFCSMIRDAAHWAHTRGKRTVLGGMSPIDPGWLAMLGERGTLAELDVIGVHGFPGTWETSWPGWPESLRGVRDVLDRYAPASAIWITEAGYSTWRNDTLGPLRALVDVVDSGASRVYWYSAEDLDPDRPAIDRFHEDEREYHFGLHRADGQPKLLARLWGAGGLPAVRENLRIAEARPPRRRRKRHAVVTGGAGFIGTNLVSRLVEDGHRVVVLDSLARAGAEQNLGWLTRTYGDAVTLELGDVRDRYAVRRALVGCDRVFHLAAQVAVTTSLDDPIDDFRVNVEGTVTLLDELRRLEEPPFVLFTSTNKVYGSLPELELRLVDGRWEPADPLLRSSGLSENLPLCFCTPYGCSKGAADQYVLDFSASYGLPSVVFRMSCIYGPHQHGNEDQGWVAHFAIRALDRGPITVYGDGAQVRDLLFVDDLVEAMLLAQEHSSSLAGSAFNMGGGPANALSLLEALNLIAELNGGAPTPQFAEERAGDQRYYVSDTTRFADATGWQPAVSPGEGIERLYHWLLERRSPAVRRRVAR
ncbi:MAG: NAD-dependent epimerase/dehydratase family protein [Gaiellaceae bacterium]